MNKQGGANASLGARVSKRGAAMIFLAVCVVFSLLVLGGGKLSGVRAGVVSVYDGGEESIIADLTKHNENAYNIMTVAKRVLGESDETLKAADAAYKAMNGASTPAAKYAADQQLDGAIDSLVSKLSDSGMNEKDTRLVTGQKADMESRDMIISHSEYNAKVTDYSSTISRFPANLIALLRGLGAPEYYR